MEFSVLWVSRAQIITFAIYFGYTTTEKAEKMRKKKLKVLHLIAGAVILILGIGMLVAVKMGII